MKKDKITLKKRSWNDVSINEYYQIMDITEDTARTDLDKEVAILAVLCQCTEDEIYDLPMFEINELTNKMGWIKDFKYKERWRMKSLTVAGKQYDVCVDLQEMTVSQYIDFQAFWSKNDLKTYIGNLLAVFLVPKGKSYCEGYSAAELAESFRDTIPVTLAMEVCFFFARRYRTLMSSILIYYRLTLKRLNKQIKKGKQPNPELVKQLKLAQTLAKSLNNFLNPKSNTAG